jgi:tRNA pseudouridine13 synthase
LASSFPILRAMTNPIEPPLLTAEVPGVGGTIKREPADFDVEEIPAYEPCGQGDHLFLWIEKTSMGAEYFARQVAQRLKLHPGDVGTAGLKDRHAVTRQYVSVPASSEPLLGHLEDDNLRMLRVARHTNKLRPGHLRGNRFRILVRDADSSKDSSLQQIIGRIKNDGLPNYYGTQRFGKDGETSEMGMRLLRGEPLSRRPSPFLRKLALSAAQSWLFNACLAQRLGDSLMRTVLNGDVMAKWPAGGMFTTTDRVTEQIRFNNREIIHTGPIFGRKMFPPASDAADRESAVLSSANLTIDNFSGFGKLVQGTRRHNLIYIDDLAAAWEPSGLRLSFSLPAGCYATVLLRELMKIVPADVDSHLDLND